MHHIFSPVWSIDTQLHVQIHDSDQCSKLRPDTGQFLFIFVGVSDQKPGRLVAMSGQKRVREQAAEALSTSGPLAKK